MQLQRARESRDAPDLTVESALPGPTQPWRLLCAPGVTTVEVPGSTVARTTLAERIAGLPAGSMVAVTSAGTGAPWRARRFAKAAGLTLLREYVAIPSTSAPTCYVEDEPETLRYFFSQLLAFPRGAAIASAAVAAAKTVTRPRWTSALAGGLAPNRLVLGCVGAAGGRTESSPSESLLDPAGMRVVLIALSKDPNAKLTVLLFPRGAPAPTLAVKVPTTEAAAASIAAERRALLELHARLPASMLATIPALADVAGAGPSALVTTALPGSPMTTRYHAWRHLESRAAVEADFRAASLWLSRFQAATAGPAAPLHMDFANADVIAARFARDPHLRPALDRLGAVHERLRSSRTPRTAVHGDFWWGNLLLQEDQVTGVVDWEAGSPSGEPARDLVRFALTFALYLDRHTAPGRDVAGHPGLKADAWGAGIEYSVDGQGWFPDLFRQYIREGLSRLGADPRHWRDAALAGIAEIAATADHADFARHHWELFARLSEKSASGRTAAV